MRVLLNDCIVSCEHVEKNGVILLIRQDEEYYYDINLESEIACERVYNQLFESGRTDLSRYRYNKHRYI